MIIQIASAALLSVVLNIATAQEAEKEKPCDRRAINPYACMSDEEIAIKKAQEQAERKQRQTEYEKKEDQEIQEQLAWKERRLKRLSAKMTSPFNCQHHDVKFGEQDFFTNFNDYTAFFDLHCDGEPMHKTLSLPTNTDFDSYDYRRREAEQTCGFLRTEIRRYLRFAWAIQCPWAERYSHDYPSVNPSQLKPKPRHDGFFIRWFDGTAQAAGNDE